MNFHEGMRRVGLTTGILGALIASYAAYQPFADLAHQRKVQAEFESLVNLPMTQNMAKQIAEDKIANADIDIKVSGIEKMRVDDNGQILWFKMNNGGTVMRGSAPSVYWYLLYPLIAAVGFLAPWGAIRLITWIVSGFIGGSPSP